MQTVEKTGDFLPASLNTGDEWQSRPEESVATFGETQEHYSSVSVQIFHCKETNNRESVNTSPCWNYQASVIRKVQAWRNL